MLKSADLKGMHSLARDLLHPGSPGGNMHRIDKAELLNTLTEARREARLALSELQPGAPNLRLHRILVLLGYMAEHLEMVGGAPRRRAAGARYLDKQGG